MEDARNPKRDEIPNKQQKNAMSDLFETARAEALPSTIFATLESAVLSTAISPDGRRVVVGLGDGSIQLFDLISGELINKTFSGHNTLPNQDTVVKSIAFSPNGQHIVSGHRGSLDGLLSGIFDSTNARTICIWNLDGTLDPNVFSENESSVNSVAISPNGELIVSGSIDGKICLWSREGALLHQDFQGHTSSVNSVAFSAEGDYIVSGSDDGTIKKWTLDGTQVKPTFSVHYLVQSISLSSNGKYLVSGGRPSIPEIYGYNLSLWNFNDQEGRVLAYNHDAVDSVAISPDDKYFASSNDENTIVLRDFNGNLIGKPLYGHRDSITTVEFTPDGKYLVSGSQDRTIRLWEINYSLLNSAEPTHNSAINALVFSPSGNYLVSGGKDGSICLWKLESGSFALTSRVFVQNSTSVNDIDFSLDEKFIVSGSQGSEFLSDHQTIQVWKNEDGKLINIPQSNLVFRNSINSISCSPDGKFVVAGSKYEHFLPNQIDGVYEQDTLQVWKNEDGLLSPEEFFKDKDAIASIRNSSVSSVSFSPAGNFLLCDAGKKSYLWDSSGNLILDNFESPWYFEDETTIYSFSQDGSKILGYWKGTICIWNLKGKLLGDKLRRSDILSKNKFPFRLAVFSPCGKFIISTDTENNILFWDLDGNYINSAFSGHESRVNSIVVSPDGRYLVSGSDDTSIRLSQVSPTFEIQTIWSSKSSIASSIPNLSKYRDYITESDGIKSDLARGQDSLDIKDEIDALSEVILRRKLEPPLAVGILGAWGGGKSFAMHLLKESINQIRCQSITAFQAWGDPNDLDASHLMSSHVGHIYQVHFNAWTYSKSDLWCSLMQEVIYTLDRQITLEKRLGDFLKNEELRKASLKSQKLESDKTQFKYINKIIVNPYNRIKHNLIKFKINKIRDYLKFNLYRYIDIFVVQVFIHYGLILWFLISVCLSIFLDLFFPFIIKILTYPLVFLNRRQRSRFYGKTKPFWDFIEILKLESFMDILFPKKLRESSKYYFLDYIPPSNTKVEKILLCLEFVLFIFVVGLYKRIRHRKISWRNKCNLTKDENDIKQNSRKNSDYNKILRDGGEIWKNIYKDESEIEKLIPQDYKNLNSLNKDEDISNRLWSTLEALEEEKYQHFRTLEHKLIEAEKTLERKCKSAEAAINQKLSQRKFIALWVPFFNAVAHLKFSKEQIETFSASGQSFQKFPEAITSWKGLLVLLCMSLLITISISEIRAEIFAILQFILPGQWFQSLSQFASYLKDFVIWSKSNIHPWLQFGSVTLIGIIPALKALTAYMTSVQKEQARIQAEGKVSLKQTKEKITSKAQEVIQLRLKVEEIRQQLGPNAQYPSLTDFVNARLSRDDYGKHLGIMQQVKQDLAILSSRLTLTKGNHEEMKKLFPRGPVRVVLYIDDLDRCPPDRVVEVLEAVQLLLNTELFVVILAIDDRYIARALEQVYEGVLKRRGKPSGIDYLEKIIQIPYRMRPISPDTIENYFRSQLTIKEPKSPTEDISGTIAETKMTISSSKASVTKKFDSEVIHDELDEVERNLIPDSIHSDPTTGIIAAPSEQPVEPMDEDDPSPLTFPEKIALRDLLEAPVKISPNIEAGELQSNAIESPESRMGTNTDAFKNDELSNLSTAPQKQEEISYKETIATVEAFDEEELNLLVDCCQYVDITPRTGKRLINIYKILQIIWKNRHEEKSHPLPTEQTKQVVMSFLVLSGRYPDFIRGLFDEIDMRLEQATFASANGEIRKNPSLTLSLSDLLATLKPQFNPSNHQDFHAKREWTRFDTNIRQMLHASNQFSDDPEFDLDRRTFSLMLSFCFVGDLGYDPDDRKISSFPSQQDPEHSESDRLPHRKPSK